MAFGPIIGVKLGICKSCKDKTALTFEIKGRTVPICNECAIVIFSEMAKSFANKKILQPIPTKNSRENEKRQREPT